MVKADIVAAGKASVFLQGNDMHPGMVGLDVRDRIIDRAVVNQDNLEVGEHLLFKAAKAVRQVFPAVPVDNDDGNFNAGTG